MYVIGDIHGCYNTLKELLNKLDISKGICFVGDLIDRGDKSAQVVKLVRKLQVQNPNIHCVKGNHEQMMVDVILSGCPQHLWTSNGGDTTIRSYRENNQDMKEDAIWMNYLPIYIELPDKVQGQRAIVSHSTCTHVWELKDKNPDYFENNCLWSRGTNPDRLRDDMINIVGHTIVNEVSAYSNKYINIDTGAFLGHNKWVAHKEEGMGKLTAIDLDNLEIIQQDYIDGDND